MHQIKKSYFETLKFDLKHAKSKTYLLFSNHTLFHTVYLKVTNLSYHIHHLFKTQNIISYREFILCVNIMFDLFNLSRTLWRILMDPLISDARLI